MNSTGGRPPASSAILTVPNLLSFTRILLIPAFVGLIVHRGTELAGMLLFAGVAATDWVDGYVARRTNQVSELGKMLDPIADRLAVAAGLVAVMVRGALPLWAGVAILARDAAILVVGAALVAGRGLRVDVRFLGKSATAILMISITSIAWGNLELPLAAGARAVGWVLFSVGIVESYLAAAWYLDDIRGVGAPPSGPRPDAAPG
ncbi:MAG: CDP-alcohol phosphatidyltransferase family protein [Actinobacteria bacterium]|nr:CDP-alcohol phosphatidyltransferase family protein [Actinomycetota bacterium]